MMKWRVMQAGGVRVRRLDVVTTKRGMMLRLPGRKPEAAMKDDTDGSFPSCRGGHAGEDGLSSAARELDEVRRRGGDVFEFLSILGRGGMGVVYLARNKALARTVAVKVIRRERSAGKPELLKRFLREAQNTAALEHPNIVTLYAVGELDGIPYLEMRYIDGRPLSERCRRGPVSLPAALRHVHEVARALAHAHSRGIVHRDIKPANILVDRDGHARVVDFGLSLAADDARTLTESGALVGSLHYLSPECWDNRPADARSDLYALGIMMFQLLTGRLPYEGSVATLARKHLFQPLPEVRDLNPDVPAPISALLRRLTAKRPDDRCAGAAEVQAALERVMPELAPSGGGRRPFCTECNPYPGLSAFQPKEARWFFGRHELVERLVKRVIALVDGRMPTRPPSARPHGHHPSTPVPDDEAGRAPSPLRFLCILGPSGVGKSSLIGAGLIPRLVGGVDDKPHRALPAKGDSPSSTLALSGGDNPVSETTLLSTQAPMPSLPDDFPGPVTSSRTAFRVVMMKPGGHPLESLARAMLREGASTDNHPDEIRRFVELFSKADAFGRYSGIGLAIRSLMGAADAVPVLIIDQFEEVFTLCADPAESSAFVEGILEAAGDAAASTTVLLTLRSDFLDETRHHRRLNQAISDNIFMVPVMTEDELRAAIIEPAARAGFPLDDGVTAQLVQEVHARTGALPLLQFALSQIWEGLRHGTHPARTLEEIGGVGGSLAQVAERVYRSLSAPHQAIARRVFLGLIQLGSGVRDSRRRADLSSLIAHDETVADIRPVLLAFSQQEARLITLSGDEPGEERAEITHEALIEHWDRLRSWLEEAREDIRFGRAVSAAAEEWVNFGCPESLLWETPKLDLLRDYVADNLSDMTAEQVRFFEASEAHREAKALALRAQRERERALNRRLRRGMVVLTGVGILALVLAAAASLAWWRARDSAMVARLAQNAERKTAYRAQVKNAQAALIRGNLREARDVLDGLISAPGVSDLRGIEWDILRRHVLDTAFHLDLDAPVGGMAASSSGDELAFVTMGGLIGMWSFEAERIVAEIRIEPFEEIRSVHLSPSSDYFSVSAFSGGRAEVRLLARGPGRSLEDRGIIADSDGDGDVYVCGWTADDRLVLMTPGGLRVRHPAGRVVALAGVDRADAPDALSHCLLRDGRNLVVQRESGVVEVWDIGAAPPRRRHLLPSGGRLLTDASADGDVLLMRNDADLTIRRVDLKSGYESEVKGGLGPSASVVSPEGDVVLSTRHGRLGFWLPHWFDVSWTDLGAIRALITTRRSTGERWVIKGDLKSLEILRGLNRWWEVQLPLHHEPYLSFDLALSADGRWIAAAGEDFRIRLMDARGRSVEMPTRHRGPVLALAFSPDGTRLYSGGEDGDLLEWDVSAHRLERRLGGDGGIVRTLAVSGDGRYLAVGRGDGRVGIRRLADGEVLRTITLEAPPTAFLFPPGADRLVIGEADGTIASLDLRTWEVSPLSALGERVARLALSPDGRRLAAVSALRDGRARIQICSLPQGRCGRDIELPIVDLDGKVGLLAFTPDERRLLLGLLASLWVFDAEDDFEILASFPGMRADGGVGRSVGAGIRGRRPKPTPYLLEPGARALLAGPSSPTRYPLAMDEAGAPPGEWSRLEESAHPSRPVNMDLSLSLPGGFPAGWLTHPEFIEGGFTAVTQASCDEDTPDPCIVIGSRGEEGGAPVGGKGMVFNLFQRILAKDYRGRIIRFSGEAALDPGGGHALPWVRVDRTPTGMGFFDNAYAHPLVSVRWTPFEIVGRVDDDAMRISFGILVYGSRTRIRLRRLRVSFHGDGGDAPPGLTPR